MITAYIDNVPLRWRDENGSPGITLENAGDHDDDEYKVVVRASDGEYRSKDNNDDHVLCEMKIFSDMVWPTN